MNLVRHDTDEGLHEHQMQMYICQETETVILYFILSSSSH